MIAIGIDPGSQGGVAFLDTDTGQAHGEIVDTKDVRELADLIRQRLADEPDGQRVHVAIEKVQAMPGGGKRRMGASSAFTFGKAAMGAEAVAILLGLPWSYVRPQDWTALALDSRPKPKAQKDRKAAVLNAARDRWPGAGLKRQKDGAIGEALWMALFVARREYGTK